MCIVALATMGDRGNNKRPRTGPIRWGIMGAGLISSDFVGSLQDLPPEEAQVVAVAARSQASAEKFAQSFGIPRAYEGYETLAADPGIDVIYIGTVAQTHTTCVRLALSAESPCSWRSQSRCARRTRRL